MNFFDGFVRGVSLVFFLLVKYFIIFRFIGEGLRWVLSSCFEVLVFISFLYVKGIMFDIEGSK